MSEPSHNDETAMIRSQIAELEARYRWNSGLLDDEVVTVETAREIISEQGRIGVQRHELQERLAQLDGSITPDADASRRIEFD